MTNKVSMFCTSQTLVSDYENFIKLSQCRFQDLIPEKRHQTGTRVLMALGRLISYTKWLYAN